MSDNDWWPDAAAYLDMLSRRMMEDGDNNEADNLLKCANHIRSLRKEIETLSDRLHGLEKKKPLANE